MIKIINNILICIDLPSPTDHDKGYWIKMRTHGKKIKRGNKLNNNFPQYGCLHFEIDSNKRLYMGQFKSKFTYCNNAQD